MKNILLILFIIPIFGISQDWNLNQNEIIEPQTTLVYDNVYLNDYTIEMKNGSSLSIVDLYGSGSIVAFNDNNGQAKPALAICSYTCDVNIDSSQFGNQSIPIDCNSTLTVNEFNLQENEIISYIWKYGDRTIYIIKTKEGIVKRMIVRN